MRKKIGIGFVIVIAMTLGSSAAALAATKSTQINVKGSHGEILTVSRTVIAPGTAIRVVGQRFDETIGIYLAFCVLPKKGELPTPCGGGINKEAVGDSSYWISSNPPPYGIGVAQEFAPGGRFSYIMHISPVIGKIDCRKIRCAITIRADHTRDTDRAYDMFVPIKFK
ncbi:MAG: hypothetical protein H7227_06120 [Actinobacteria bacterium]|nr:hypothetical protein [Actinomycetota bacterium]